MEFTDAVMVSFIIGGTILVAGCMIDNIQPVTVRLLAFALGCVLLGVGIIDAIFEL